MAYNSEGILENDWLLRQEPFEGLIGKELGKAFEWLSFAPKQRLSGSSSIAWAKELYSADNDPLKRFPRRLSSGSDFARITASKITSAQATLAKWGFEFVIAEEARRYKTNLDVLGRTLKKMANWVGEWQNAKIIESLINPTDGVQTAPASGAFRTRSVTKWSAEGCNPVKDMILLGGDFEDAAVGYKATDFFVEKTNFREALQFLMNIDVDMSTREKLYGVAPAKAKSVYIPVLEATLHSVEYGLDEGDILVMDAGMSPFTIYYDWNPEYGPAESFTMENGQVLPNDFGLHSHQYKTDKNHELIQQIWLENVIAVKDASAGMYNPTASDGI